MIYVKCFLIFWFTSRPFSDDSFDENRMQEKFLHKSCQFDQPSFIFDNDLFIWNKVLTLYITVIL